MRAGPICWSFGSNGWWEQTVCFTIYPIGQAALKQTGLLSHISKTLNACDRADSTGSRFYTAMFALSTMCFNAGAKYSSKSSGGG